MEPVCARGLHHQLPRHPKSFPTASHGIAQTAEGLTQPLSVPPLINQSFLPSFTSNMSVTAYRDSASPAITQSSARSPTIIQPLSPSPEVNQPSFPSAAVSQPPSPSPTVNQPSFPSPAVSQPPSPSPAVSQPSSPSPAVNQPSSPSLAVNQPSFPSPAVSQPPSPSPAVSQPSCPSPAVNQPSSPSQAVSQPSSPSPAVNQPSSPSPAVTQPPLEFQPKALSLSIPQQNSCKLCGVHYAHRTSLSKHMSKEHPNEQLSCGNIKCLEESCNFTCRYLDKLRHHLKTVHSIPMETEEIKFKSFEGMYVLQTTN